MFSSVCVSYMNIRIQLKAYDIWTRRLYDWSEINPSEIDRHGFAVAAMAAAPPAPEEEDPDGPARRVPLPHDPAGGEGLGGAAGGRDPPGVPLARPRRHPDGRRAGEPVVARRARDEPALWRRIDMRGSPASPTGSATGATPSAPWRARRCAAAPGGARSSGARSAATTRCSASSPTSEFTWINISLLPSISSQFLNF